MLTRVHHESTSQKAKGGLDELCPDMTNSYSSASFSPPITIVVAYNVLGTQTASRPSKNTTVYSLISHASVPYFGLFADPHPFRHIFRRCGLDVSDGSLPFDVRCIFSSPEICVHTTFWCHDFLSTRSDIQLPIAELSMLTPSDGTGTNFKQGVAHSDYLHLKHRHQSGRFEILGVAPPPGGGAGDGGEGRG